MQNDSYISASEVGEYLYCHRAWFLKLKGYANQNADNLLRGAYIHSNYAQKAREAIKTLRFIRSILILGFILLFILLIIKFFS